MTVFTWAVLAVYAAVVLALAVRSRRKPRRRHSVSELTGLSRGDVPEWPYVRVPQSSEVEWERVTRAVDGEPPPGQDPLIVRKPKDPQQGKESR